MKIPTCECHKKMMPKDAEFHPLNAMIGHYTITNDVVVRTPSNYSTTTSAYRTTEVTIEKIATYREVNLPLNYCPSCGAPYKESE